MEAVSLMDVLVQLRRVDGLVTFTVGAVVLPVMVLEAVALQPAAVIVTV